MKSNPTFTVVSTLPPKGKAYGGGRPASPFKQRLIRVAKQLAPGKFIKVTGYRNSATWLQRGMPKNIKVVTRKDALYVINGQ